MEAKSSIAPGVSLTPPDSRTGTNVNSQTGRAVWACGLYHTGALRSSG